MTPVANITSPKNTPESPQPLYLDRLKNYHRRLTFQHEIKGPFSEPEQQAAVTRRRSGLIVAVNVRCEEPEAGEVDH
jgi:hypothetical protein